MDKIRNCAVILYKCDNIIKKMNSRTSENSNKVKRISSENKIITISRRYRETILRANHPEQIIIRNGRFVCNICNADLSTISILVRHIKVKHLKDNQFKCAECGLRFPRDDQLKSHLRLHSSKTYFDCQLCDEKFRYKATLNHHMDAKHTAEEKRKLFNCDLCTLRFTSTGKLATHKKKVHKIEKEKNFSCILCGKRLFSSSFKTHILMHTTEKPYRCEICNKTFSQNSNLQTHRRLHDKDRVYRYICQTCGKGFDCKQPYEIHLRIHAEARDFPCKICNKKFKSAQGVRSHIKTHLEERPYKCEYCGKSFKQYSTLKLHTKLHLDDKPHKCKFCGKRYTQRVNLNSHIRRLHDGM